jgi:hypothetical protein
LCANRRKSRPRSTEDSSETWAYGLTAKSGGAQIARRGLACSTIGNEIEKDLLSLAEATHTGAFDRADMYEYISAAVSAIA